jgi:hypothetical protein
MQLRAILLTGAAALVAVAGPCAAAVSLPNTSGNYFSADGTLEYAASGKSHATVKPGCAVSPRTGQPHTPVFLAAGKNVISAANGTLSTDYYVRDGGDGHCVLAP